MAKREVYGAPTLDDALLCLSQKTAECEARGEKSVVFCEDRLTLLAERAVLRERRGTFLTEVATFKRFLSGSGNVLSKQGSVMAVGELIETQEESLHCFRKGSAKTVYETLAQLAASRVDWQTLQEAGEEQDGLLRLKLLDLAFLLRAYGEYLGKEGFLDENGYLALLPARIRSSCVGKHVFFFAFPSFTKQALEGVRAAAETASSVTGIFLAGEEEFYTNEAAHAFRLTLEEYGETASFQVKNTLSGDAKLLHSRLFDPERTEPPLPSGQVHLFRASDEAEEANTVCAAIKKYILTSEGEVRYRDIAILTPTPEAVLTVRRALESYQIPYFADVRRPLTEHPFAVFTLAVLSVCRDGLPESVDAVAANVYFGDGDEYRNYLLRYGAYRGAYNKAIKDGDATAHFNRDTLERCRDKLRACVGAFPRMGSGNTYCKGVKELFSLCNGEDVTSHLQARAFGAERDFLSLDGFWSVVDEIGRIAGNRRMDVRTFSELLQSGLDAVETSLLPRALDAVFVGDATESKFERVKYLFLLGATDVLPRVQEDVALVSDGEIAALRERSVEIEPAIAAVNARARESLALNACAFTEHLFVGCPQRSGGEDTRRGELFTGISSVFETSMPTLFPYDCSERQPALLALLHSREETESGRAPLTSFPSLYRALAEAGEEERMHALLGDDKKGAVPRAGDLYFSEGVSPTLLETYFSCPYSDFMKRALRVRERDERPVQERDTGNFVHTVLQMAAEHFDAVEDEAEIRAIAEKIAGDLLTTPAYASLNDTDAGVYKAKRLVAECGTVTAICFSQLKGSAFHVKGREARISVPELGLFGKADRIDEADDFVRVIDYKTGDFDGTPTAYYTGRRLQLELYLLGALDGGRPAGAFYFPAAEQFGAVGKEEYRMQGFFCKDDAVIARMDKGWQKGSMSVYFEGGGNVASGMTEQDLNDFLAYAVAVSSGAIGEMKAGNLTPSPYQGACVHCQFGGACAFTGLPRSEKAVKCADIVGIVRRERGEA